MSEGTISDTSAYLLSVITDCPVDVDKVSFRSGCMFHSGETCQYTCSSGYDSTVNDSSMICNDGSWNTETPCEKGQLPYLT